MDQEKTYKWIQDRLRDLHSGTLSEGDRMRLEEYAKSDPFIADALEGYQSHANHDHSVLLKVIAQRIQNKNVERRPKLIPLSRGLVLQAVAASFVLILATWAVIYYVQIQNDPSLVAAETADNSSIEHSTEVQMTYPDSMNEAMALSEGTSDELNDEPSGLRANANVKAKAEAKAKETNQAKANNEAKANEDLDQPVVSAPSTYEDINEVPTTLENATETLAAGSISKKSSTQKDDGYYANQMDPALMAKRITGQVLDFITGEFLVGVQLSIPNTNIITTTDLDGRFALDLPEPSCLIQANYTGYVGTLLKVSQGEEDVVIKLRTGETIPPISAFPGPSVNSKEFMNSFYEYINSNSRFPIQKNNTTKTKEVIVNFTVSQDGRPRNINSVKSTAEQKYMVEAYRLIMEGPAWFCNDYLCGKEYTIYFK